MALVPPPLGIVISATTDEVYFSQKIDIITFFEPRLISTKLPQGLHPLDTLRVTDIDYFFPKISYCHLSEPPTDYHKSLRVLGATSTGHT